MGHHMARPKVTVIDRDKQRAERLSTDDFRGATEERLKREPFEVGGDGRQGVQIVRVISPLERMKRDGRLSGAEYGALQRYQVHWYHSGQQPALSSVDPNMGVPWLVNAFMLVLVSGMSLVSLGIACVVLGGAQVLVSTYGNPILGGLTIVVLAALILRFRPQGFARE